MKLVLLLEDESMKRFLEGLLPRILPGDAPTPVLTRISHHPPATTAKLRVSSGCAPSAVLSGLKARLRASTVRAPRIHRHFGALAAKSGEKSGLIPHEGKADLEKSIPRKLKAWVDPNVRFVVVRDQDSGNCVEVKRRLAELCATAGRPDTLIRIACHELESWYLADLAAVDRVYGTNVKNDQQKRTYREPDRLGSPSRELAKLVPRFQKLDGAKRLGVEVDIDGERSTSFAHFVRGVRHLAKAEGYRE